MCLVQGDFVRWTDLYARYQGRDDNEYKIDRTLPSRMREDVSWRQTFIKILLDYYYKDIKEPVEVQVKTNEYRQENNDFYNWLCENIKCEKNNILKLKDVVDLYTGKASGSKGLNPFKKDIEKFIKESFKEINYKYQNSSFEGKSYRGWLHVGFKCEGNDDFI